MRCKLTLGFPVKVRDDVASRRLSYKVGTEDQITAIIGPDENSTFVIVPFDTDCELEFVDVLQSGEEALNPLKLSVNIASPEPAPEPTPEPTPLPEMTGEISIISQETVNDDGSPIA